MSSVNPNPFSAVDATLGYLYQIRSSLLLALRRLKVDSQFLVSLEILDDVAFETKGLEITDLIQTKHHKTRSASLSDTSVDLWKTLRVWFEGSISGEIPENALLYLITTSKIPDKSAASYLRCDMRNVDLAKSSLDAIVLSSTNTANLLSYKAYQSTSSDKKKSILGRIVIIDCAPTITELDKELRKEIFWTAKKEHLDPFLERLEGWWFRRTLAQLTSPNNDRINSNEIEDKMTDLRDQFRQDSLPIDDDILSFVLDESAIYGYHTFSFVIQLKLIETGERRVSAAIRDYYRAFQQRSRWLRDDLVGVHDLEKYEKYLVEEWELVFDAMRDEVGDDATEQIKKKAARSVLEWAERTSIPIRSNVNEPFITRGSLHMLADEIRIGWHPDFIERIEILLKKNVGGK